MAYRMVVVGAMFCTCAGRSVPQAAAQKDRATSSTPAHLGAVLWHAWQAPAPCQPQRASRQFDEQHAEGIPVQDRRLEAIDRVVHGWKASRHSQRGDNPPTRDSVSNQQPAHMSADSVQRLPSSTSGAAQRSQQGGRRIQTVSDGGEQEGKAGSRRFRGGTLVCTCLRNRNPPAYRVDAPSTVRVRAVCRYWLSPRSPSKARLSASSSTLLQRRAPGRGTGRFRAR